MKKILLCIALVASVYGAEATQTRTGYLDDKTLDSDDLRLFVGFDGSYNYFQSTANLDKSGFGHSFYVGMPILSTELILKQHSTGTSNFNLTNDSITMNIPISGTGSRMVYMGIIGGNSKVTYNDGTLSTNNLDSQNKSFSGNFYGAHIGKRYKFSQNFFTRMEFEYLKYNKSSADQLGLGSSMGFVYGVEYRF